MEISENREITQALNNIRKKYTIKMKYIWELYEELGTNYEEIDNRITSLIESNPEIKDYGEINQ